MRLHSGFILSSSRKFPGARSDRCRDPCVLKNIILLWFPSNKDLQILWCTQDQPSSLAEKLCEFDQSDQCIIWGASFFEDVALVEFMYLVFTRMLEESYRKPLRYLLLLCLCDVFPELISPLYFDSVKSNCFIFCLITAR